MVSQALDSEEDEGEDLDPSFALDEETSPAKKPAPKRRVSTPSRKQPVAVGGGGGGGGGWQSGLPHEILLKIFRYYMLDARGNVLALNPLKCVCQTWNRVALDPKLLFDVDFSLHASLKLERGPAALKRLASQLDFFFTERLSLAGIPVVYEQLADLISKKLNADQLVHLDLSGCLKVHKSAQNLSYLKLVADRLPSLTTLKLGAQNVT